MKTILLIWYNHNHNNFYYRFCYCIDLNINDYYVGYKNAYGHEIISILLFDEDKTIYIKNFKDCLKYYKPKKIKFKYVLIDKLISLLNKLKR